MENNGLELRKVCRLCLSTTNSMMEITSHESRIQMFGLCLPEIDLSICCDSALCSNCFHSLENTFVFKMKCLQTEEKLRLYLENCDPQNINLRHITECVSSCKEELDAEICRSCLGSSSDFASMEDDDPILRNMFTTCVPEMDLSLSNNPIICNTCANLLKEFYAFKSKCLQTEEEIINFKVDTSAQLINLSELVRLQNHKEPSFEHMNLDSKANVESEYKSILDSKPLAYDADVKTETLSDNEINMDHKFENIDIENLKPEIVISEEQDDQFENFRWGEPKEEILRDINDVDDPHLPVRLLMLTQNAENPLAEPLKWYTCEVCSYQSNWRHHLERHKQIHEVKNTHRKAFKCCKCDFKTQYKHALLKHSTLTHGEWFKCEECEYQTKWKRCYNQHLLNHKGGLMWHQCELCVYKTKWKYHLKRHMVTHQ